MTAPRAERRKYVAPVDSEGRAASSVELADLAQSASPLPPVPVGPDGEAAGPEANSTHPVEIRGKADA